MLETHVTDLHPNVVQSLCNSLRLVILFKFTCMSQIGLLMLRTQCIPSQNCVDCSFLLLRARRQDVYINESTPLLRAGGSSTPAIVTDKSTWHNVDSTRVRTLCQAILFVHRPHPEDNFRHKAAIVCELIFFMTILAIL